MSLLLNLLISEQFLKIRRYRFVTEANGYEIGSLPLEEDIFDVIDYLLLDPHDLLPVPIVYHSFNDH